MDPGSHMYVSISGKVRLYNVNTIRKDISKGLPTAIEHSILHKGTHIMVL